MEDASLEIVNIILEIKLIVTILKTCIWKLKEYKIDRVLEVVAELQQDSSITVKLEIQEDSL